MFNMFLKLKYKFVFISTSVKFQGFDNKLFICGQLLFKDFINNGFEDFNKRRFNKN